MIEQRVIQFMRVKNAFVRMYLSVLCRMCICVCYYAYLCILVHICVQLMCNIDGVLVCVYLF